MADTENKYAVPVDALERSAHVPLDDQVYEHPEPPTPDVIGEQRLEAQRLTRIVGMGAFGATAVGSDFDFDSD